LTGYCVTISATAPDLRGSHELLYSSKPIRQIAREFQFESQEAFTRAFSSISGISPGNFARCSRKYFFSRLLAWTKAINT
ncbi:MAG: AraC family transcriptional regulator, partial [Candidatus Cloacimonetes bacterium]|nr:AraC family transcriptional regulator [Candidatus Cloacimonadota bacterium]